MLVNLKREVMDIINNNAINLDRKNIQKYALSDVSSCTFSFKDGTKSNVKTPKGREFVIVKFLPKSDKDSVFQEAVMQNYMYVKDVEELSEKCGYTCLRTFTRHFKKSFKSTPYQWMLDRKMEDVRYLVLNSTLPISEIAEIFNFKSSAHLVNQYSAKYGISPLKNRTMLKSIS